MIPIEFEGVMSFDRDNTRVQFEKTLANQGLTEQEQFRIATGMMEGKLIEEMKNAIRLKNHFVSETPLSHPDYWRYIDLFQKHGYQIQLNYLCLDKVTDCIARVGQRVLEGGHFVEPATIKGVYEKNLEHINEYKDTFVLIELYDGMKVPTLLARIDNNVVTYALKDAMKKKWLLSGMPTLAQRIKAFLSQTR